MSEQIALPPYPPLPYDILWDLPELSEKRLQRLVPRIPQYYKGHQNFFLREFLPRKNFDVDLTMWDGVTLLGCPEIHQEVIEQLRPTRQVIEDISGRKVQDLALFFGNGFETNLLYRSIGDSMAGPFLLAIADARSCFYNIDDYLEYGIAHSPEQVLSRQHEFAHTAINVALEDLTGDIYVTDHNKIIHEALGGPSRESWENMNIPRLCADIDQLDIATGNFWGWYGAQTAKYGTQNIDFFANPVAQSFYLDYVYAEGRDINYWYNEAIKLVT